VKAVFSRSSGEEEWEDTSSTSTSTSSLAATEICFISGSVVLEKVAGRMGSGGKKRRAFDFGGNVFDPADEGERANACISLALTRLPPP